MAGEAPVREGQDRTAFGEPTQGEPGGLTRGTEPVADKNQSPEQKARDTIDAMLEQAGWKVQAKQKIDFRVGLGIAVRE